MTVSMRGCMERWTNKGQGYPGAKTWRGWRCTRSEDHTGPCALVPRWWNFKGRRQMRKVQR